MRLLEITNDFPPALGGIENFTYSLVRRWERDDVVVLTRLMPGSDSFDRELPFEVVREPVGTLMPTPALLRRARDIIRSHSIDVVHFASSFPLPLMGPALRRACDLPFAVSLHGGEFILPASMPALGGRVAAALRRAGLLLPNSGYVADAVARFVGDDPPLEIVTPGVDPEMFSPDPSPMDLPEAAGGGPVIVSVCRLVVRKGPGTLLRALPRVLRRHPDARTLIVGGGPDLTRLRRLAASLGLTGIVFTGPVAWSDVPRYYRAATLFAHPARERFGGRETEGFGMVYLEAASSSVPVVGGDVGGARDAVDDGRTGYLVDGRSSFATAEAILTLLDDPQRAAAMGARGRARVMDQFTWESVAQRFQEAMTKHLS
ncbi:MAG: glycosyltransferase family 4 protein [Actinomycetota bacterium]